MSLIIFGDPETYPSPGVITLVGTVNGTSLINWQQGTVQNPTSTLNYSVPTNNVTSVLLDPGIGYANYLNQSGVGGVFTLLQFTPTGSVTGPTVTENVLVGSFAYWNQAINDLYNLSTYVINTQRQSEIDAFNQVDLAYAALLQGANPSAEATQIQNAIGSLGDPTFAQLAARLQTTAASWDVPVYELNTGNGFSFYSSDPAPFGLDLYRGNATWATNGSQGGVSIVGYTAYTTYDFNSNNAFINVAPAEANGSLEIASTASSAPMATVNDAGGGLRYNFGGANSGTLWEQAGTNALAVWQMTAGAITGSAGITSNGILVQPDSSWALTAIGNFFSFANTTGLLWRQSGTEALAMWRMNGTSIASSSPITSNGQVINPDASWKVVGTLDYQGQAQVLWRQSGTGALAMWAMSGSTILNSVNLKFNGNVVSPDSSWSIAAIGDFNGDSNADILWRQGSSGALAIWQMQSTSVGGGAYYVPSIAAGLSPTSQGKSAIPDSSWNVVGAGNFVGGANFDTDLLWRQSGTETLAVWLMNGSTITSSQSITSNGHAVNPDASWNIIEVADFNGDGRADLLWQQSTTGALSEWLMNGSTITSSVPVTSQGSPVAPNSTWQALT